jgi:Tfp pilus assembly protein PilF
MISIPIRPIALRLALLIAWGAVLVWLGWPIARATIGDSIITFVTNSPNLANQARLQLADEALAYAPNDPLTRWQRGGVYLAAAADEEADKRLTIAVSDLRAAADLSPRDYRIQLTLGRALEHSGATAAAQAAFERATQLAPHHFEPHWSLANHLLRAGQRDAAFAAMSAALRTRPSALPLALDYAWEAYRGDARAIAAKLAPTNELRSQLAVLLATRNQADEALALWRESGAHTAAETQKLVEALLSVGRFKAAYESWRATNNPSLPQPDAGSLLANGGFEQNFDPATALPFLAWRINSGKGVSVSLDQQNHAAGKLSLRTRFDLAANNTLILATQTAPVKAGAAYRLSFAVKTEELQSLSTPFIGVYDAADEKRLRAAAPPIANGTHDWQEFTLDFTTHAATEAVALRVQRLACAEPPCPLTGRLWLDNFKLTQRTK